MDIANLPEDSQLKYDRGLHYGDGLFETIAVKSGSAELLDKHINRLKEGCVRLKLINIDFNNIREEIENRAENITKGVIKLIVTRGIGGRGYLAPDNMKTNYIILDYPWPNFNPDSWDKGIAVKKCDLVLSQQPLLAGIKHLNRLENVMARMELIDTEFKEGLLCDSEHNVIEATSSNVFIVVDNIIKTPILENSGVAGIMREHIIALAQENKLQLDLQEISYESLCDADEIFLTNSIIGIWPVTKLNERIYSNLSLTRKLMTLLNIKYDTNAEK